MEFLDLMRSSDEVFGRVPGVVRVPSTPAYLILKGASVNTAGEDLVNCPFRLAINGGWGFRFLKLSRQQVVWVLL